MKMPALKLAQLYVAVLGASIALHSNAAYAQKYDSRVGNPFVFCMAPKPCKLCYPFRGIYEDICADQAEASKKEDPNPLPTSPSVAPTPAPATMNEATRDEVPKERDAMK
ncbi:hypothetical protein RCH14_004742 [Massilia sp. MP_M2]|uniref:hypothetical protein n=1 Tax=Massilia sp. MP_M2 TaxID=3071713 RepID=UPI00319E7EA9